MKFLDQVDHMQNITGFLLVKGKEKYQYLLPMIKNIIIIVFIKIKTFGIKNGYIKVSLKVYLNKPRFSKTLVLGQI